MKLIAPCEIKLVRLHSCNMLLRYFADRFLWVISNVQILLCHFRNLFFLDLNSIFALLKMIHILLMILLFDAIFSLGSFFLRRVYFGFLLIQILFRLILLVFLLSYLLFLLRNFLYLLRNFLFQLFLCFFGLKMLLDFCN